VESIRDFRELLDAALARGEAAISVELVRGRMVMVTAIAPDYQMRNRKVLLAAPAGDQPNVDLLRRELLAKGAKVMLATPGAAEILRPDLGVPLTADYDLDNLDPDLEMEVLLIAGGEGAVAFREHEALLTLIRRVLADDNRVLACAGESALLPLLASEEKLSSKITLPSDLSGEAVRRGANYTGKDVETEKKIVTTTGADREILRQFLRSVANQH